jgi:hypothetical protein
MINPFVIREILIFSSYDLAMALRLQNRKLKVKVKEFVLNQTPNKEAVL